MVCGIVWSRIHSLDSREREPTHFSSKWESFERGGFSLKHFGKEGFGGCGVGGTVPAQREKFTCLSPGAQHPAFPSPGFISPLHPHGTHLGLTSHSHPAQIHWKPPSVFENLSCSVPKRVLWNPGWCPCWYVFQIPSFHLSLLWDYLFV